jgi:hypothetical protein
MQIARNSEVIDKLLQIIQRASRRSVRATRMIAADLTDKLG